MWGTCTSYPGPQSASLTLSHTPFLPIPLRLISEIILLFFPSEKLQASNPPYTLHGHTYILTYTQSGLAV